MRVRILGSGGKTGLAYFLHLNSSQAEDQLDIWQTLRDAPHPNLNRPVAVGRRAVAGLPTIYMVLADADEQLAAVVPERPLEWEEAAEVLHSCEKALAHLHAHGLIHGSVSPDTVEAVGYTVLLNVESVCRLGKKPRVQWREPQYLAPESKGANLTTAADVWCLGATLVEVLSQHPYGAPEAELDEGLPLAAVIQRFVDKNPATRCTLKEAPAIEASPIATPLPASAEPAEKPVITPEAAVPPPPPRVSGPPVSAPPLPPPPAAAKVAEPAPPRPSAPPDQRTGGAARLPLPLTPKPAPPKQVSKEDMALVPMAKRHKKVEKRKPVGARIRTLDGPVREGGEDSVFYMGPAVGARILGVGSRPKLVRNILGAIGVALLLFAAIWFVMIPHLQQTEEPIPRVITSNGTRDTHPAPASSVPAVQPPPAASVAPASPDDTSQDGVPFVGPKRERFRVVISSLTTRLEASREMDALSQQHPELFVQIVPVRNMDQVHFLVVVGGIMTRAEAEPLQQRLLAKGLKTAHLEPYEKR